MVELDIQIDKQEIQQLDNDLREAWPEGGMKCEVIQSFSEYTEIKKKHWKKTHEEHIRIHFCNKCKSIFINRCDMKRCYIVNHRMSEQAAQIILNSSTTKIVENENYISPGSILPRKKQN
jgi:hypothetical protein